MAEEEAVRQRAPEPTREGVTEPRPITDPITPCVQPLAETQPHPEQPSWREPDDPVLPALMNRKRTTEKRDQIRNIRFTPTAVRIIHAEAERRGQRFASFVGDAALAAALGETPVLGSPEDDPVRPLVEAVEGHIRALNRIGNNLNQITGAIHRGSVPDHAEGVLIGVGKAVESSYRLIDQLVTDGAGHGA
ncbi:plasmid mobilization relaxosome protein MobC [Streptomyces sp. NPDC006798]|uniref:plasmid mobilization relaxosome protein MobC n=1 Tax=Streptomyces sp. NPDC006798 TaxID=3155462 RepID=UPI0033C17B68